MWKSTDGGANWTAIDSFASGFPQGIPVNIVVNDPYQPATLYAGTFLGLYQSLDAGATWARSASGLPFTDTTDIYISPDSSLLRLATFGRGFWELKDWSAPTLTLAPASLPAPALGVFYPPQTFTASGGTSPYTFELTAGTLPPGLTFNGPVLSGQPVAPGQFCFTIAASDSTPVASGGPFSGSQDYCMSVKSTQVISFASLADRILGVADFGITATTSSGLTVELSSLAPAVCTINVNVVHLVSTGTCTIRATQPGNALFDAATPVTRSFAVKPPDVTPPVVVSITGDFPNPTMSHVVTYVVTFSEPVTGVAAGNLALAASGVTGSGIATVSGGPVTWAVEVNTGRG